MREEVFFDYSFCIQIGNIRKIQFEVSYIRLGRNKTPHFATSAEKMNNCRTDINEGGQAQKSLLPESSLAYKFYKKWNKKHVQALTEDEIKECLSDIEELKEQYDYVCIVDGDRSISFQDEVNLQRKNIKMLEHVRSIIKEFDYKIHEK